MGDSGDASLTDPFFVSWGASVNVSEDLRRTIRTEIEGIDSSISSLQSNLKNEERKKMQLSKDLSHARSEMTNLCRGAADELENATVNEEIRKKMAETIRTELMANIVAPASSPTSVSALATTGDYFNEDDGCDDLNNDDYETDSKKMKTDAPSLASQLCQTRSELQHLSKNISETKEELIITKSKINEIETETESILNHVKSEDLIRSRNEVEREVETRRREREAESQRMHNIKESIQRARKRCGDYAQQIADLSKTLSSEKSSNSSTEAALTLSINALNDEIYSMERNDLADLEKNKSTVTGELDYLIRQFAEVDAMRKTSKDVDAEHKKNSSEVDELKAKNKDMEDSINEATVQLQDAEKSLRYAKDLEATLVADKRANDKNEDLYIKPAIAKRAELAQEKEYLAGAITDLHQKSVAAEEDERNALAEMESTLTKLLSEIKEKTAECENIKAERQEIKRKREENDLAAEKEIASHTAFKSNFEEACQAEQARIEDILEQRRVENENKVNTLRQENDKERKHYELMIQLYHRGSEIIENTEQLERQLKEAPIHVDINDIEDDEFFDAVEEEEQEIQDKEDNSTPEVNVSDNEENEDNEQVPSTPQQAETSDQNQLPCSIEIEPKEQDKKSVEYAASENGDEDERLENESVTEKDVKSPKLARQLFDSEEAENNCIQSANNNSDFASHNVDSNDKESHQANQNISSQSFNNQEEDVDAKVEPATPPLVDRKRNTRTSLSQKSPETEPVAGPPTPMVRRRKNRNSMNTKESEGIANPSPAARRRSTRHR